MVLTMERYNDLRERFVQFAKYHSDNVALGRLKNFFSPVIRSNRALDQIKTIEDLIKILEKRGVLSYDKIDPLKAISKELVLDAVIHEELEHYDIWVKNCGRPHPPNTNLYKLYNGEYELHDLQFSRFHGPALRLYNGYGNNARTVILHSPDILYNNGELIFGDKNCEIVLPLAKNGLSLRDRSNDFARFNGHSSSIPSVDDSRLNERDLLGSAGSSAKKSNLDANSTPLLSKTEEPKPHVDESPSCNRKCQPTTLPIDINNVQTGKPSKFRQKRVYLILALFVFAGFFVVYIIFHFQAAPSAPSHEKQSSYSHEGRQESLTQPSSVRQTLYWPTYPANATNQVHYINGIPVRSTSPAPTKDWHLQQTVFLRVSERLGRKWKDTARCLDIRESEIDEIEGKRNVSLKDKALEALNLFASRSDSHYWQRDLKRALEEVKRRDLRDMVEELILRRD